METGMEIGNLGKTMLGVQAIRDYMSKLPPEKAQAMDEIYETLKDRVDNKTQVQSTVMYMYRNQGLLGRAKTAPRGGFRYWAKTLDKRQHPRDDDAEHDHNELVQALNGKQEEPVAVPVEAPAVEDDRPEIRVEANRVIILHPKCRVIVELP